MRRFNHGHNLFGLVPVGVVLRKLREIAELKLECRRLGGANVVPRILNPDARLEINRGHGEARRRVEGGEHSVSQVNSVPEVHVV